MRPFADALALRLDEFGIVRGEVKLAPDMETMAHWLTTGEVDVFMDSFYPARFVADLAGIQPSLLYRKYPSERTAVFFALRDSGLTTLDDLAGQTIAFDDRSSTTGFMLPMAHLARAGLRPVEMPVPSGLGADQVGYVFAGGDTNVVQWVASRRVIAGVVDNVTFEEAPSKGNANLIVLDETDKVVHHQLVLLRPEMDPALENAIKALLLESPETLGSGVTLEHLNLEFFEISRPDEVLLRQAQELYDFVATHGADQAAGGIRGEV